MPCRGRLGSLRSRFTRGSPRLRPSTSASLLCPSPMSSAGVRAQGCTMNRAACETCLAFASGQPAPVSCLVTRGCINRLGS